MALPLTLQTFHAPQATPAPVPPPSLPVGDLGQAMAPLGRIRAAARRARCGRQMMLGEAVRRMSEPGAGGLAPEVLVRVLREVIGQRPVIHPPGSRLASFDEAWLCRCHAAQKAGDTDSLAFLVGRRVPVALRRPFLDILRSL